VRRYVDRQGWQFAVTLDQASMRAALSTRNLIPLTVTVDRQGRLKQVIPGEMSEEDVLDLLKLGA
jgi:thiol:disulfide interchange protein